MSTKVETRRAGKRRLIVVRSLLAALDIDPDSTPFGQRVTCTIEEAKQATGIGRTKLYEMMEIAA
jgi:hypothetical protein